MKYIFTFFVIICFVREGVSQQINLKPFGGTSINTKEFREHAFSISGDGKTFVFAQDRPNGTQLFQCTRVDKKGSWSLPKPIKSINNKLYFGKVVNSTSLTFDGSQLYFSAELPGGLGDTDIYLVTHASDGEFGEPQNLGEPLNTVLYEGYPSVSADGNKLFFVRETFNKYKGVENCYSIWMVKKGSDGTWSNFEKLSETINSACEKAPFIMPDGQTLMFSSIREGGKGGFDIYQSELQDDGSWTYPIELDFMNSASNDEYIAISGESDEIYLEVRGDIFSTALPKTFRGAIFVPVQVQVIDVLTRQEISAKIKATSSRRSTATFEVQNGNSKLNLRIGNNYNLACSAVDYVSVQSNINLENFGGNEIVTKTIELMPTKTKYIFKVLDKDGTMVVGARMKLIDMKTSQLVAFDGHNTSNLTFGKEYLASVSANGYLLFSNQFIADAKDVSEHFTKNFTLIASNNTTFAANTLESAIIEENKVLVRQPDFTKPVETFHLKSDGSIIYETKKIYSMNDINFDKSSVAIKSEFYVDINRLIELLTLNPKINVQLAENMDSEGDPKYNQILTEKRIKSCVDYLSRAGIEARRILIKGFGQTELTFDTNPQEDKSNRVKFIIY